MPARLDWVLGYSKWHFCEGWGEAAAFGFGFGFGFLGCVVGICFLGYDLIFIITYDLDKVARRIW